MTEDNSAMPGSFPGSRDAERPPTPGGGSFPLAIGAIDIGSNSIRFVAAKFTSPETFVLLDSHRAPVRLGRSSFRDGRLAQDAMESAVTALAGYRKKIDDLALDAYRAVATSAVRFSANRDDFVRLAEKRSRINVEVITGWEEAYLTYAAVRRVVPLGDRKWVLVNLGGGSVEVSIANESRMLWNETHNIGAVRIIQSLLDNGCEPPDYFSMLREYVDALAMPERSCFSSCRGIIATGGNIEVLASLAGSSREGNGVTVLETAILRALANRLGRYTCENRSKKFGLKLDRADVILPAAMVYERIASLVGAKKIIVPGVGTKEGILYDMIDRISSSAYYDKSSEAQLLSAATSLGHHYGFDQPHAQTVSSLALSLFEQFADLHKLGERERRLLAVAAVLHDVGNFVSYNGHHRHSLYLISNSELPGMSENDMLVAANIARYHRKSEPSGSHEAFASLTGRDQARVIPLAAILRLADALDRDHMQAVRSVRVSLGENRIVLLLETSGKLHLDIWAFRRKKKMFVDLYGYDVVVSGYDT